MPLKKGRSRKVVSENISELHSGQTYAHTREKFGKARANRQAIAIAMSEAGMVRNRKKTHVPRPDKNGYY